MITEEAANEHEPPSLAPDRPGYHLAVVVVFLLLLCVSWPWRIFEVTTEPVGNGRMAASLVAFPLAGFQVIMHGRIGVFTEASSVRSPVVESTL